MSSRQTLADFWSAQLEEILDAKLEGGTPVIDYILITNPDLRERLRNALNRVGVKDDFSEATQWGTLNPGGNVASWDTEFMAREISARSGHPLMHRRVLKTDWKRYDV